MTNMFANCDIFNEMQVGIILVDDQDIIVKTNKECGRIFATEVEQLPGKTIVELFLNFDLKSVGDFFRLSGMTTLKRNLHILSNNDIYVSFTASAMFDTSGNYTGSVITCTDISDSLTLIKQLSNAQSKLGKMTDQFQEERDKNMMIIESISDGVLVLNPGLEIIHANLSLEAILGVDKQDLIGKKMREVAPEFATTRLFRLHKYYESEEITIINRQTGEERILVVYFAPIRQEDGPASDMVFTVRDTTKQKQIDNMKSQFVSNVSHELRTPLASIKGFTSTLLRRPFLTEEQKKKFLSIIDSESDRLTRLIEDLLSLSRIESSTFELKKSKFDLIELTQDIHHEIESQLLKKELSMVIGTSSALPPIIADKDKVHQVLLNLINNAIKFTYENTTIEVDFSFDHEEKEFVLSVTDHGPGISKENIKKVFDKFFRVENVAHTIPGTGLGLSIVQTIIQKHNGRIELSSELEKFTTFKVILPQGKQELDTGIQKYLVKFFNHN